MSIKAILWATDQVVPPAEFMVLTKLARTCDHNHRTPKLSQRKLAPLCRCSVFTVNRALRSLSERGLLRVHMDPGCAGSYQLAVNIEGDNSWVSKQLPGRSNWCRTSAEYHRPKSRSWSTCAIVTMHPITNVSLRWASWRIELGMQKAPSKPPSIAWKKWVYLPDSPPEKVAQLSIWSISAGVYRPPVHLRLSALKATPAKG